MVNNREKIEEIHLSLVNGQRKQMVEQIDDCLLYSFWEDYKNYLGELYPDKKSILHFFADAVISYFRIKNR